MAAATAGTRRTYSPPKMYTFRQLEELWIAAGGRVIAAPDAAAIALAESNGNPNAINHNNNGSVDRGLWQINSVHGGLSTVDVRKNAEAAVRIYNQSGGSWSPWATYKSGAYASHLTPANVRSGVPLEKVAEGKGIFGQSIEFSGAVMEAFGFGAAVNAGAKAVGKEAPSQTLGKQISGAENKAEEPLEHAPSWVKAVLEFVAKEALTGILLLAGAVLVVYGIMVAVRPRESAFSIPIPAVA
jgi:hypothetical protein